MINIDEFDDYQDLALKTARNADDKDELFHLALGVVGEAGEVAEKVKKIIRDKDSELSPEDYEAIALELGDILWYIAVFAEYLEHDLSKIAEMNVEKLRKRSKANTLSGSGDDR